MILRQDLEAKPCIECANSFDGRSRLEKFLMIRSVFDDRCRLFRHDVSGEAVPCMTVRIMECRGEPPQFVAKDRA